MSHRISATDVIQQLSGGIIKPLSSNFVERPWGGTRMREFKGLCSIPDQAEIGGAGLGETFEIAAFDSDVEAQQHPSIVELNDGKRVPLPHLLAEAGKELLGQSWLDRHGSCVPLLPKFLNIRELLSVQGHPAGHTEVYVVIDAEPGASIRLGFRRDMNRDVLQSELQAGLEAQRRLAEILGKDVDWIATQRILSKWFAARDNDLASIVEQIDALNPSAQLSGSSVELRKLIGVLQRQYWYMLDAMNEIELVPGQVIFNSNPQHVAAQRGIAAAAEVHALGNPEGREIVMLEIRRPGPTLRAWDNVRFPMRDIDIVGALEVLNLNATQASDFIVEPVSINGANHRLSIDTANFRVEHIYADSNTHVDIPSSDTHCLHVVSGSAQIKNSQQRRDDLTQGESGLVPYDYGSYRVTGVDMGTHVVKVSIP